MKNFFRILLIVLVCVIFISALFSLLSAVLGIAFGIIGSTLNFLWRVIFSPVVVIAIIIFVVIKLRKKPDSK